MSLQLQWDVDSSFEALLPASIVVEVCVIYLTTPHCRRLASSRGLVTIFWWNDWEEHR